MWWGALWEGMKTGFWGPEALPCLGRQGGVNRNNDSYNTKGVIHIKGTTKLTVTILRRGIVKLWIYSGIFPNQGAPSIRSKQWQLWARKLFTKKLRSVSCVWIPSIPLVWWWLALPLWCGAGLEGWLSPCSVLTLMFRWCCWGRRWPWDIPQQSSTVRVASCSAGAVWPWGGWRLKKIKVDNYL